MKFTSEKKRNDQLTFKKAKKLFHHDPLFFHKKQINAMPALKELLDDSKHSSWFKKR